MNDFKKYAKALVTILGAVVVAIIAAISGVELDGHAWTNVGLLLTTAAAVYVAPNVPGAKYTKVVLAVLGAGVTAFVSVHNGGVTGTEALQVLTAVLTAAGVYKVKNITADGVNLSDTGSVGVA